MRHSLWITALATFATGCATVTENLSDSVAYKRTIHLSVNGYYTDGMIVLPKAASYHIEGSSPGGFDYLLISSCHREYDAEKQGDTFSFDYPPTPGIEDNRACPLHIHGFEKIKGRHSFGFIDFENDRDRLPAESDCDGNHKTWTGVGNCQGPVGAFQRVVFPTEVYSASARAECKIAEPVDLKTYLFKVPLGECVIEFEERATPHRTFRLNTYGYQETVVEDL